jgi:arabinose-5-phosphate isomerase
MASPSASMAVVLVDRERKLLGIFTDGDLRRVLTRPGDPGAVLRGAVREVATVPCRAIRGDELLHSALRLCSEKKINELPVVDAAGRLEGLLDLQDLVDRGFALER